MNIREGFYYTNLKGEVVIAKKAMYNSKYYPFQMFHLNTNKLAYTVTLDGRWDVNSTINDNYDITEELSPKEYPEYYL